MNKVTFFLFFVLTGLTLVSCDPKDQFKAELATIDSCMAVMDTLQKKHDGIDFDSLKLMVEHVSKNEALVKQYYQPDTLDEAFGKDMNDSKSVRKKLGDASQFDMKYAEEMNAIKHQLMDLKEDVTNGVLSTEQINEYIAVEKAALKKVEIGFLGFYETQLIEKARYYLVVPRVDAYLEKLIGERDSL